MTNLEPKPKANVESTKTLLLLSTVIMLILLLTGCATPNYYTGRTLEDGEMDIVGGMDNLLWVNEKGEDSELEFSLKPTPSLGVFRGLPWRFEAGMRLYLAYILEASLRHQINPRSFDLFDISANIHVGTVWTEPYGKYGLMLSKDINDFHPYVGLYAYNNFLLEAESNVAFDYRVFMLGLGIPLKDFYLMPEINIVANRDLDDISHYTIGIGVRRILR
jgi:hypothetical protein